jgi:hypothetical protein
MEYFISFTIIVAAGLWVGILLVFFSGKLITTIYQQLFNARKNLEQSGVVAEAVILKLERKGMQQDRLRVKLQVQVQPDRGRNFIAELVEVRRAGEWSSLHTGSLVKVKYNPQEL